MKNFFWMGSIFLGTVGVGFLSGCRPNALALAAAIATPGVPTATASPRLTKPDEAETFKRSLARSMRACRVKRTLEVPFYSDSFREFAFSLDEKLLAGIGRGFPETTNLDGSVRGVIFLYDVQSGALKKRLAVPVMPTGWVGTLDRAVWSPDGKFIAAWNAEHGRSASLLIWNVSSGQLTGQFQDPKWNVTATNWTRDGTLLVARSSDNQLSPSGQILECDTSGAAVRQTVDLGTRQVNHIDTGANGFPRMLVLTTVGLASAESEPNAFPGEAIIQSSLCTWKNRALSAPLVQFQPREAFLGAAFGRDVVALCGIRQFQFQADGQPSALYALVNLRQKRIVWQRQKAALQLSFEVQLSPDEKQIWAHTGSWRGDLVIEATTGVSCPIKPDDFSTFSPDGAHLVRQLDSLAPLPRGKKPHLAVAQLWERIPIPPRKFP